MPDPTPKLGLPKPRGNENDTRLNYIALIEAIDNAAAPASATANQALAGIADAGLVAQLLSWLAGMIKAITGAADWKTVPAWTLAKIKAVLDGTDATKIPAAALAADTYVRPACNLYNSTVVPTTTNTDGTALFDTELIDTNDMHSLVTSQERITINTTGLYLVMGRVTYEVNTNGNRGLKIVKNAIGDVALGASAHAMPSGTTAVAVITPGPISLVAGDYLRLLAYQDSGIQLNIIAMAFGAVRVG